jgi:pimeloyl-ACP methyl ester carboxylesterase
MHHLEELEINTGTVIIRGKRWRQDGGIPTLCLHGFLDNAASFDLLAPKLKGLDLFAMDFAGHGLSDHRPLGAPYTGLSDLHEILSVADHLGWTTFSMIGHSMGAELGAQLAGLFPDRVRALVCLDGYCGTNTIEQTLDHLSSMVTSASARSSKLKVFDSLSAMAERLSGATGQSLESAQLLVARGHRPVPGGYTWRADSRVRGGGPLELTPDQLRVLVDATRARTAVILADIESEWLKRSLKVILNPVPSTMEIAHIPAHHHFHMHAEHEVLAEMISTFLAGEKLPGELSPEGYRQLSDTVNETGVHISRLAGHLNA